MQSLYTLIFSLSLLLPSCASFQFDENSEGPDKATIVKLIKQGSSSSHKVISLGTYKSLKEIQSDFEDIVLMEDSTENLIVYHLPFNSLKNINSHKDLQKTEILLYSSEDMNNPTSIQMNSVTVRSGWIIYVYVQSTPNNHNDASRYEVYIIAISSNN